VTSPETHKPVTTGGRIDGIRNRMLFKDKDQNKQGGRAKPSANPRAKCT